MGSGSSYVNFIDPLNTRSLIGMGSGSQPKTSGGGSFSPPPAPQQQNQYNYNNGFLQSSSVYDKSKDGYVSNQYGTPDQVAGETAANKNISDITQQMPGALNLTQDQLQKGVDAYTAPQYQQANLDYNKANGLANDNAGASGMQNSIGFSKFMADELARQKAQTDANIAAGGEQMRYQLPQMALAPYQTAMNINNSALNGIQTPIDQSVSNNLSGLQLGNNFATGNYPNQLGAFNASIPGQAYNGFTSRLFGGF